MIHLLLLACRPPGPVVVSAAEQGLVEARPAVQGRDGGTSALAWGRSIWTYGDTVLNVPDVDGTNWHHNSYAITDDLDASDGIGGFTEPLDAAGAPDYLIPPTEAEHTFNMAHLGEDCAEAPCGARWAVWPGEPVWDEARQRALVFYGLIYAEPGAFNFEGRGSSVAIWTDPEGRPQRPLIDAGAEHPDILWGEEDPGWGLGSFIEGDTLYSFSCSSGTWGVPCILGCVDLDHVLELEHWRYRSGQDWTTDRKKATMVVEAAPIFSLSYASALEAFLMIYSPSFDDAIVARTAPELWGPWSEETVLFVAKDQDPYDAVAHAELAEEEGRVQYITWSRSSGEGWFGTEFPVLRVELE